MKNAIYLDNNATTRIDPEVVAAMNECLLAGHVNPASQHQAGQQARAILENARERVASILNVDITSPASDRLIFTSGGTEANNLAIFGLGKHSIQSARTVITSAIEHPSILSAMDHLPKTDRSIIIKATEDGCVDLNGLEESLDNEIHQDGDVVLSIMTANNETGVLQPLDRVVELGKKCQAVTDRSVFVHTDAVQAVGKIPVDFTAMEVSAMTISAHKFHGPCGIGALALRKGVPISPMLFGGSQQLNSRPGTESVALAVGMAVALERWQAELSERVERLGRLRDRLEAQLRHEIPDIRVNGIETNRVPHTSNISFPGIDRQAMLMALDFAGIQCATGSACESGSSEPSHVLSAMMLPEDVISSAIRLSLSAHTTDDEVDQSVCRISKCVNELRKHKSGSFSAD